MYRISVNKKLAQDMGCCAPLDVQDIEAGRDVEIAVGRLRRWMLGADCDLLDRLFGMAWRCMDDWGGADFRPHRRDIRLANAMQYLPKSAKAIDVHVAN